VITHQFQNNFCNSFIKFVLSLKYFMFLKKNIYLIFLIFSFLSCEKEISTSPNVIFILTDDQGYGDLGVYGADDILTPNIDFLASQGARFTSYYATQPVCSASRASILTGSYSDRISIYGAFMPNSKKGINSKETTIAEMLKDKGYSTGIFGKWHLGDAPEFFPTRHGFDEFFGILYSNDMWPYHPEQGTIFNFDDLKLYENENVLKVIEDQSFLTEAITDKAINFIEKNKNTPFFLYIPHPQPHVPLFAKNNFLGTQERGIYGDVINEIDFSFGRIYNVLKKNNLVNNTVIIFTSDNGPWLSYGTHSGSPGIFREGKGTCWEGGNRVPAIISYPKKIKPNTVIKAPVMGIDWLPTIKELSNSKNFKFKIDGKSLVPLLTGTTYKSPHENLFFYYRENELHAIRHLDWKYYLSHSYRSLNGKMGKSDGTPIKYEMNFLKSPELYNLTNDPEEKKNVADLYPNIVKKIDRISDSISLILGNSLKGIKGNEVRPIGLISD